MLLGMLLRRDARKSAAQRLGMDKRGKSMAGKVLFEPVSIRAFSVNCGPLNVFDRSTWLQAMKDSSVGRPR